jgi:hypothetical protein
MNIIGRYEKVRMWYPYSGRFSSSYILDYKNNTILPSGDRSWVKTKEGIYYPVPSGGIGNPHIVHQGSGIEVLFTELDSTTFGRVAHILDSAYVAGTSGDAVGTKFYMTEAKTVSDVYFDVESYLGTAANVNDINIEIRAHDAVNNLPDVTGPGLIGSGSVDPASQQDRWVAVSGLSISLSADTIYWLIVADADGNTTDRANMVYGSSTAVDHHAEYMALLWNNAGFTTDGWQTATILSAGWSIFVVAFSDGTALGWPWLEITGAANDTNQKGIFLGSAFNGNARIYGVSVFSQDNDIASVKIWEGTTGPSGTPFATSTFVMPGLPSAVINGAMFTKPFPKLTAGTDYRIVIQPGAGAVGAPDTYSTGPVSDNNIRAAFPGSGNWYNTRESGGAWADDVDLFPLMGILVDDFEADVPVSAEQVGRVFPVVPA